MISGRFRVAQILGLCTDQYLADHDQVAVGGTDKRKASLTACLARDRSSALGQLGALGALGGTSDLDPNSPREQDVGFWHKTGMARCLI